MKNGNIKPSWPLSRLANKVFVMSSFAASVLSVFGIILMFLPKITIIDLGLARAGIRVDDFIIAATGIFGYFIAVRSASILIDLPAVKQYLFFCAVSFVSISAGGGHWIFPLRYSEYIIITFIGLAMGQSLNLINLFKWFLVVNCVISVLQYIGVVGGFAITGYQMLDGARVMGVTNHPSEFGLVVAMSFAFILGSMDGRGSGYLALKWFSIAMVSVILSGSRAPFAVLPVVYILWHIRKVNDMRLKSIFAAGGVCFTIMMIFAWSLLPRDTPLGQRFEDTFSLDNISAISKSFSELRETAQTGGEATGGEIEDYARSGLDASLGARLLNFAYVFGRVVAAGYLALFIGVGPGYFGSSMDMGYIRIFAETGIIGLSAYLVFMRRSARMSLSMYLVVVTFALNMFTLDAYQGYKIMLFFFIMLGAEFTRTRLGHGMMYSRGTGNISRPVSSTNSLTRGHPRGGAGPL
jgi:hypothetical protein